MCSCGFSCMLQAAKARVDTAVAVGAKVVKRSGNALSVGGASMPFLVCAQLCVSTAQQNLLLHASLCV